MENKMIHNSSWKSICIIGFGGHAKNKLLPAIKKVGLNIDAIVSRDPMLRLDGAKTFSKISDAIKYLPDNTLFIISSPPDIHYLQAKELIIAGKDIFIEKPAFTSKENLIELSKLANQKGSLMLEMFMYFENKLVRKIIRILKNDYSSIDNIDLNFYIPLIPPGTFRDESTLARSLLSDIGCYPLSLLAVVGFDLSNLNLEITKDNLSKEPNFCISGESKKIKIEIRIGVNNVYLNNIAIRFKNKNEIFCEPFFYGRSGYRKLVEIKGKLKDENKILEKNSYELMFSKSRDELINTQEDRFNRMYIVTENLERLGKQAGLK